MTTGDTRVREDVQKRVETNIKVVFMAGYKRMEDISS
jgi:hypothetical protein